MRSDGPAALIAQVQQVMLRGTHSFALMADRRGAAAAMRAWLRGMELPTAE